jgi:multiple sugar transport system ATP-binding protein
VGRVVLDGLEKRFPDGTVALHELSLSIADGELLVLVGPSGCGKTTTLRIVAGLETATSGSVTIDGRSIDRIPARDRDIAMVFQNYALYPNMTVRENIMFPLKLRKHPKRVRQQRTERIASLLGLEDHLDRKPAQLSGGQRQRVAMGRALVREPEAFLMDEPLSNLDAKLRVQMRSEISQLQKELAVTTLYVTHDQLEAMTLGDRVVVLHRGHLQQVAPPQEIYDRPASLFVAGFIGSPPMNFLEADVIRDESGALSIHFGQTTLRLDELERARQPELPQYENRSVVAGIRPEGLLEARNGDAAAKLRSFKGDVAICEALGSDVLVHLTLPDAAPLTRSVLSLAHEPQGAEEASHVEAVMGGITFIARFPANARVAEGDVVDLAIAPGAMRFFDPTTGAAL